MTQHNAIIMANLDCAPVCMMVMMVMMVMMITTIILWRHVHCYDDTHG